MNFTEMSDQALREHRAQLDSYADEMRRQATAAQYDEGGDICRFQIDLGL